MTTTTYPAGTRLRCPRCGATTVVLVEGARAWCNGTRAMHRSVAMRVEKEEARR